MFDDLSVFYADFGTLVTREGGAFLGILTTADVVGFDVITHGTHTLRYPTQHLLEDGDTITIAGQGYRVAAPPRRIADGLESIADLVMA